MLTGLHGAHVTVGIIWLLSLWGLSMQGRLPQGDAETVEIAGLYWHFVDVVWIVIFTVVYLIPSEAAKHERHRDRRRPKRRARAHEVDAAQGDLAYRMSHAAPSLLPGELRAHPDAVPVRHRSRSCSSVITAVEIAVSYLEGDIPDGLIVVLLLRWWW